MKNGKIISGVVEKLRRRYHPESIILFGSYAYGTPKRDSDIDLLIIKDTKKEKVERFVEVKRIIYNPNFRIPVSPLVYTPKELKKRIQMGDQFIKEIVERGKVLYDEKIASQS